MSIPAEYSLEFDSSTDFWAQGGDSARRTFIMPLSKPLEFLAFGVLAPSNEVLFVAHGQVARHLGDFIKSMVQAGASVELYARPPLPDSILAPYIDDGSHDQKEADEPPPPPDASGQVTMSTGGNSIMLSSQTQLWTMTGTARRVLVTGVPESTDLVAFGMVEVNHNEYRWSVNFVARLASDGRGDFVARMENEGAEVQSCPPTPLPTVWAQYMDTYFPDGEGLAASMALAQLEQAESGAPPLALG